MSRRLGVGLERLLSPLLPPQVTGPLRRELGLLVRHLVHRRTWREHGSARDLLVNVGAGRNTRPGWLHVDGTPSPGIDRVADVRRGLPLPEGVARGLFCEHFLEHLTYRAEAPRFLAECRRVLAPGGVLRVVVPDAGRYLLAYASGDWAALAALRDLDADRRDPWLGRRYRTRMELINTVFRQGTQHLYAYDAETLVALLERAGFVAVAPAAFGVSRLPELAIDSRSRKNESLVVEGTRPEEPMSATLCVPTAQEDRMALDLGSPAPDFALEDQAGTTVRLSDLLAERTVVLFFYPKDETPGCTVESCTFRDSHEAFLEAGAEVVGISGDSVRSHRAFADRHGLGYRLLADTGNRVRTAYGVKATVPVLLPGRETFVIDRSGIVRHRFSSQLHVKKHVEEALRVVEQIAAEPHRRGADGQKP